MMDNELQIMLNRYLEGELASNERQRLAALMRDPANQLYLAALLDEQLNDNTRPQTGDPVTGEQIRGKLMKLMATERPVPVRRIFSLRRWWAAAAIVGVLATGAYLWMAGEKKEPPAVMTTEAINMPPGRDGAVLTLADGSQVVLDSLGNGLVAVQNGANAVLENGRLAYDVTGGSADKPAYNTVSTPKGRQFQIVLPDGSRVWLNAASSLRYPVAFAGKERNVEVTGEAYFEVMKNSGQPFIVNVDGRSSVEVLGTSFNVNSYTNEEDTRTSLLEGSVKITARNASVILKPGQQAIVNEKIDINRNADVEQAIAWKNGLFNFEGLTLKEVMRQLERWYDIRVQFEGPASRRMFEGKMYRNVNLSDVLEVFKKMGLDYEWDGSNALTVY